MTSCLPRLGSISTGSLTSSRALIRLPQEAPPFSKVSKKESIASNSYMSRLAFSPL
jgi:hypothetical protein